ncbi:UDP-GlcNAc--UDP-phosphate GlcNAc-1-phosphate transferase [Daejeonella sp.]|uniref:UDP-GlcNAc--UDP-phosphate GlcNAc-1-phosphate transferase n=1 Tax=Daejeonella sp. TaxID=2805397 RepID=UPI0030C08AE9
MLYLLYLPGLFLLLHVYFWLADRFNIIDEPNHRSSHKHVTIRGAGIIFPIAVITHALLTGFDYPLFVSGLLLISFVSFYDDLRPLSNKIRVLAHLIAVFLLFKEADLISYPFWIIILSFILVIGAINAYNFMDGINGITGSYSLVTLLALCFINQWELTFVLNEWLIVSILALMVFNFFNFRKKARCFAGDVGSVSIAFVIIFFLLLLILSAGDLKYIGLLLVYGLDSVITIIFRLIRGENIFKAHRSHFYQYLANVKKWPQLSVSVLYALVQLLISAIIIYIDLSLIQLFLFFIICGSVFVCIRFLVEGRGYLLSKKVIDTNSA